MSYYKVGDKVRCCLWQGEAEVTSNIANTKYPVVVTTANRGVFTFTAKGFADVDHSEPTLRHSIKCEETEKFEYPLYFKSTHTGKVYKFFSLTVASSPKGRNGNIVKLEPHTDERFWTPCDNPKWKPSKPTWCWVWDACESSRVLMLVIEYCDHPDGAPTETDYNYRVYSPLSSGGTVYRNAEPCSPEGVPSYWPEEWI